MNEKKADILETVTQFLKENPAALCAFFAVMFLVLFLGAVFDWNWLFGDVSRATYSLSKIDGWVNIFGRKTARIVFGALCLFIVIISGLMAVHYIR
jgi:flagellar biosynthesis protein FlhB